MVGWIEENSTKGQCVYHAKINKGNPIKKSLLILICLCTLGCNNSVATNVIYKGSMGKVVEIYDGDTLVFSTTQKKETVRLVGIDAPETKGKYISKTQPFGLEAKARLTQLLEGKIVRLESAGRGYYNRLLGTVYLDGENINLKLVGEGFVVSREHDYREAEKKAKSAHLGIWSQSKPVSPKKWRKMYRVHNNGA